MPVRVGVIGVGAIGQDHVRRLTDTVAGAEVVAVSDVDSARAKSVADGLPGVRVHPTGQDLIHDDAVDGVVVASWGPTHEEYVLASIGADKAVFCEKPLAPTPEACRRIVDAEVSHGRRLVQVGFMRRYDSAYGALKAALGGDEFGTPLMVHCVHRNPAAPPYGFTSDMVISDAAVHEIDLIRWLLAQEIAAVTILTPRRTSQAGEGLQDPQILIMETVDGVLVDVEVFINCGYGYDVRCEVVTESGTVALDDGDGLVRRRSGLRSDRVPADWRERFMRAYDIELGAWVNAVAAGCTTGPSAWDGFAAALVVDRGIAAYNTGQRTEVRIPTPPEFYRRSA